MIANGVIFEKQKGKRKGEYIPFKNSLKHINIDNFGEIRRVDCNRIEQVKKYNKLRNSLCTITYTIGTNKDNPGSFAERIMLRTLEVSKNIDSGMQNCWLYRKPNGDSRVDELPFDVLSELGPSKDLFNKKMEYLFEGLNMDNAKEYFAHQNYKDFCFAIKYNYSMGDDILEAFTAWVHDTFSGIKETTFQIFFVFTAVKSIETLQANIGRIIKKLVSVPIIPIHVVNPVDEFDIQTWKGQINLESYTQEEFLSDLKFLKVSEQEIKNYKKYKNFSMQVMETFQSKLYDAFYETYKRHE